MFAVEIILNKHKIYKWIKDNSKIVLNYIEKIYYWYRYKLNKIYLFAITYRQTLATRNSNLANKYYYKLLKNSIKGRNSIKIIKLSLSATNNEGQKKNTFLLDLL